MLYLHAVTLTAKGEMSDVTNRCLITTLEEEKQTEGGA